MPFFDPHLNVGLCALALIGCTGGSDFVPATEPPPLPPPTTTPAPPREPNGSITMWSIDGSFVASASFHDEAAAARPSACIVHEMRRDEDRTSVNVGAISIEVPTDDGTHPLSLAFEKTSGRYTVARFEAIAGRPDSPNKTIRIDGKGGPLVPAFKAAIDTAFDVEFSEPAAGFALDERTGDIPVRWANNWNDEIYVTLDLWTTGISCKWTPSDGGAVIPGAMVQESLKKYREVSKSAKTPCTDCTRFFLSAVRNHDTQVADYGVRLTHRAGTLRSIKVAP